MACSPPTISGSAYYIDRCPVIQETLSDITFVYHVLCSKQIINREQIKVCALVVDCFSDQGVCRIRCCAILHRSAIMPLTVV